MKRFFALFLASLLLFSASASADHSDYLKWRKRFITLSSDELQSVAQAVASVFTTEELIAYRDNLNAVLSSDPSAYSSPVSVQVDKRYTCFMDLRSYKNSSMPYPYRFESLSFDLYFPYDASSVYLTCVASTDEGIIDTGLLHAQLETAGDGFIIVLPDNTRYPGHYDLSSHDLWLDFGLGDFRFSFVPKYDPFADR